VIDIKKTVGKYAEEKKLLVDDVVLKLCTYDDGLTAFSDDHFKSSKTFLQVSNFVVSHSSIYDYDMLQFFLDTLNCDEAAEMLRDFVMKLETSLMKDLNLMEDYDLYTSSSYKNVAMSFGSNKPLVIKCRGYKVSNKDQELIKKLVYEKFELVDVSIQFVRIARGSLALIYRITSSVRMRFLKYKITAGKLKCFANYNISCFIIGELELKVPLECPVINEVRIL